MPLPINFINAAVNFLYIPLILCYYVLERDFERKTCKV